MESDGINLRLVTKDGIDRLLAFIPYFEAADSGFGLDPTVEKVDDKTLELLPSTLSGKASDFFDACYAGKFVQDFDWQGWRDQHESELASGAFIGRADLATIVRLLTVHLRTDHLCDGHLISVMRDGTILRVLKRLCEVCRLEEMWLRDNKALREEDAMKIIGYSERGLMNALLYEIGTSDRMETLMAELLDVVHFPHCEVPEKPLQFDTLMIEQSFSDFGDADAVLLGTAAGKPTTVFVEAKVKSCQRKDWKLEDEFTDFETKRSSSNLFTQLHYKMRMVNGLRAGGMPLLEIGLDFPSRLSKSKRKIGKNAVVRRATAMIEAHHKQCFFVALIPEEPENARRFFADHLPRKMPDWCAEWDTSRFGYTCWSEVEDFCRKRELKRTLAVFEFNKGQIYG